jgi:hypothetical protein
MRKKLLIIVILGLSIVAGSLLAPGYVEAGPGLFDPAKQDLCDASQISDQKADCSGASGEVDSVVQTIINILSLIIGIVAVVMIIINGLRFITSGGDANAVNSARNGVIYALVGLILVGVAQFIVRFVLSRTG